ncbi:MULTISPECIES: acetyl-CoA hydrolase/transferase C-terminal domain-containing protein [Pseudoxanthomonas]|uniref:Itaconate CoA-transferase n=1 Tax=Pseudoxanthomonas winnipegensis TaxID=2480810 RepID=A0AAW8GCW8_9GAMM|nr:MULTISPECIES: acetyl-CoA hydrolase/transferase C-terminal domain-containing protein [Pseudoxanthomonas]MDQ1119085.1 itaconate CoA-transferase [Pseudoxanthomonas winnipegensis]MDQ1132275.1 itaconate CoA-transferase [Pseudoxanthomonas winnipegensis]MDR6137712.1 itaconate CoA-transferase [Pseudoxanthomonas sp. SORGH_AS_0997]
MNVLDLYKSKLTTPEAAVSMIPSGSRMSMGMAVAEPPALLAALARRAERGQIEGLRVYYYEGMSTAGDSIFRYDLVDRILPYSMFVTSADRALIKKGVADGDRKVLNYVPTTFHQAPRLLSDEIGIDTFVTTVSPMDRHGYMSFGTSNDYSTKVARSAKRLIVEVNENMPRVHGAGAELHVSEVEAIVENHVPLLELPTRASSIEDEQIGRLIADLVPDRACLQMGVGALPNLVCAQLVDRKDLGIHTEALCPGLVDLVRAGVVTNRAKAINRGKSVFTFAMGQKAMYDYLTENPSVESWPVDYVNDPGVIASIDRFVSINATIQIDLTGACNSEHMLGHQYSASGGQLDFVRGAYASKGGLSIIATKSTAAGGNISKIVPHLDGPVTTPRVDTHYVVTEFGTANLKGLSSSERVRALVGLAHPRFRDELVASAKRQHLI